MIPITNFHEAFEGHRWQEFKLMSDHIWPLFFCLIDWSLNGFVYEKQQLWPSLTIIVIYGLFNLTLVETTGHVIYPGMTWDSFLAWLEALIVMPVGILLWYLIYWATNWKIRKHIKYHKEKSALVIDMSDSEV